MLDFRELSENGDAFELLVRELLFASGHRVYWSGKGADGGKDLLCEETLPSTIFDAKRLWVVQCKHFAHSGRAVGIGDLEDIVDTCAQHGADGYLLACSTFLSSKAVERLERITANAATPLVATYWDAVAIERRMRTPRLWPIAQRFFAASLPEWSIYATEHPNRWIANYRGYYFHISNRIGSTADIHFDSIERRLSEIESVVLPHAHFIRVRAVYYDDKNGSYVWFVDYMRPSQQDSAFSAEELQDELGSGFVLDDGQDYYFDVLLREYLDASEHYDRDHYSYYQPYLWNFFLGSVRD